MFWRKKLKWFSFGFEKIFAGISLKNSYETSLVHLQNREV